MEQPISLKCHRLKKDLKTPCGARSISQRDIKWNSPHCQFHQFYPPVGTENPIIHHCGTLTIKGEPCKWAVPEIGLKCSYHSSVTKRSVPDPQVSSDPTSVATPIQHVIPAIASTAVASTSTASAVDNVIRCGGKCTTKTTTCRRVVNKIGDRCSFHVNQKL